MVGLSYLLCVAFTCGLAGPVLLLPLLCLQLWWLHRASMGLGLWSLG